MAARGHRRSREEKAADWLAKQLGAPLEQPLAAALADGILLCDLANVLRPGSVSRVRRGTARFVQLENIPRFLKAAQDMGVPRAQCFDTADLVCGRNMRAVADTLLALRRLQRRGDIRMARADRPGAALVGSIGAMVRSSLTRSKPAKSRRQTQNSGAAAAKESSAADNADARESAPQQQQDKQQQQQQQDQQQGPDKRPQAPPERRVRFQGDTRTPSEPKPPRASLMRRVISFPDAQDAVARVLRRASTRQRPPSATFSELPVAPPPQEPAARAEQPAAAQPALHQHEEDADGPALAEPVRVSFARRVLARIPVRAPNQQELAHKNGHYMRAEGASIFAYVDPRELRDRQDSD